MSQAKWSPRIERARFSLGNPLDKLLTRVHVSGGDSSVNPRYHESFTASPQARGQSVARDGWYHGLMERRLILLSKESRLRRWWNPLFLAFLVLPVLPQPNHFSAKVSTASWNLFWNWPLVSIIPVSFRHSVKFHQNFETRFTFIGYRLVVINFTYSPSELWLW